MDINSQFEQAVANSKTLKIKPSNEDLLKLYSLFKQASEGDVNIDPPANPFDIVGKAKYEAWASLMGKTSLEAKQEYIELVAELQAKQS